MVDAELYPFSGRYLERGDLRLHYLDEGKGHPVVMVHGNPTWSFFYRNLVLGLRDRYRTIVPDHMGCGLSDRPPLDRYRHTLEERVDDLTALLDATVPEGPVSLVVHDWGGMIGSAWAVRHPERVHAVVAMNTAAFRLPPSKPLPPALRLGRNSRLGAWVILRWNAFCRAANRVAVKRRPLSPNVAAAYLAPYDTPERRIAVLRFVQDIPLGPGDPAWPILREVEDGLSTLAERPWLFLWGLRDFVFDHHFLAEWQRRLPEAESHVFESCGHYLIEDAPDEVVTRIGDFLDRCRAT